MPDRGDRTATQLRLHDGDDRLRGGAVVESGGGPILFTHLGTVAILEFEARSDADSFDLTAKSKR